MNQNTLKKIMSLLLLSILILLIAAIVISGYSVLKATANVEEAYTSSETVSSYAFSVEQIIILPPLSADSCG